MPKGVRYVTNVRRCKPEGSLVFTKEGLVPIENVRIDSEVLTSQGYKKVLDNIYQGSQKLVTINTSIGDSYCTPEHRMAVLTSGNTFEWKQAKYLRESDFLVFPTEVLKVREGKTTLNYPLDSYFYKVRPVEIDEEVAWLLGYSFLRSDVYNTEQRSVVRFTISYDKQKIVEKLEKCFKKFSAFKSFKVSKHIHNNLIVSVEDSGLANIISKNSSESNPKILPEILQSSESIRGAYLGGFYDSFEKEQNICDISEFTFTFMEGNRMKTYLTSLQAMFSSLAIPSIFDSFRWRDKKCLRLSFNKWYSIKRWDEIPGNYSIIYENKRDLLDKTTKDLYLPKFISRSKEIRTVRKYYEEHKSYPKFIPVKVESVTTGNIEKTFDLSVEGEHEYFCAEGLLNHNSAQIAIGDCKDTEYLNAKNWASGNIPNSRAFSNNSVVCNDIEEVLNNEDFWKGYDGHGEPYGLINLKLSQSCGRIGETQYPDPDVVCYNPCFSGDTLIGVADGRGCVSIKQLTEEDKDVPVYSLNRETDEVEIQWGRHPRVTGKNKKLYRVYFDGVNAGEYIDVTDNHKFFTTDGRELTTLELEKGDSLPIFKKARISDSEEYLQVVSGSRRLAEHRMIAKFHWPDKFEEKLEPGKMNGCCETGGIVVHHKDENKTNNCIDNLEIMTFEEHNTHHGADYAGAGNPMFGKEHSEETKKLIGQRTKERCLDPEYREKLSKAQEPYKEQASIRMTQMKREWDIKNADELEKKFVEAGLSFVRFSDTETLGQKDCENCKEVFTFKWLDREKAFCSIECSNRKLEDGKLNSAGIKRVETNRKINEEKGKANFHKQVMIYKDLQEKNSTVWKKDWEEECKKQGVPFRFQTKSPNPYVCRNWGDFVERAKNYNHRISHVKELPGKHIVYNITVDNNHNLAIVTKTKDSNLNLSGVFISNCGEQSLCRAESCCLGELYLPNISSFEELKKTSSYLYRICKHSLTLPCHNSKETEEIVHKNMRMGIGVTGYLQATEEQKSWLSPCYRYLRAFDVEYSKKHNFPLSIKICTVKPAGSLSLLGGCTSGVHPGFAQFYKRRIRISSQSSLIKIAREHGYHIEYAKQFDGSLDHNTQIITFPVKLPKGTILASSCSAIEQLEWVKRLQTEWSDNSVSVTVYYKKEELPTIKEWLRKNYNNNIKTVSFLLHSEHGFIQAPLEEINEEEYNKIVSECRPITDLRNICYTDEKLEEVTVGLCDKGSCPLR